MAKLVRRMYGYAVYTWPVNWVFSIQTTRLTQLSKGAAVLNPFLPVTRDWTGGVSAVAGRFFRKASWRRLDTNHPFLFPRKCRSKLFFSRDLDIFPHVGGIGVQLFKQVSDSGDVGLDIFGHVNVLSTALLFSSSLSSAFGAAPKIVWPSAVGAQTQLGHPVSEP